MPVTNDRYPGTSGRQHGERKVTAPAAAATGSARISGPEATSWAAPLMCPLCHVGQTGRQGLLHHVVEDRADADEGRAKTSTT